MTLTLLCLVSSCVDVTVLVPNIQADCNVPVYVFYDVDIAFLIMVLCSSRGSDLSQTSPRVLPG